MKVLLFFIFTVNCFAFDQNAQNHIQKAVLAYPQVKHGKRVVEKKIYRFSPLSEDTTKTVGAIVYSGANGEFSTKPVKTINISVFGGRMRPDVTYGIKSKEVIGTTMINWDW